MIIHYLKVAIRNLLKYKTQSFHCWTGNRLCLLRTCQSMDTLRNDL